MTKDILPGNIMCALRICLPFTVLLLCLSVSIDSDGDTTISFAVSPCVDIYASDPGNCAYVEPLATSVYQTSPSMAYDARHRMNLFIRDGNGYLEYASQTSPGAATWDATTWPPGWQYLYGDLNGDPVAISRKGGDLEVFYIGLDEGVWYIRQTAAQWGAHTSIGGAAGGQVTVAYDSKADKVQLFYKGDDQSLMTIVENGSAWGKPAVLLPPDSLTSNAASIDSGGVRYLFYRAIDGSLQTISLWPGSTAASAPVTLTRSWSVTSNIAPALDANGNVIAFYRGSDYALWKVASAGSKGWGPPLSLGGRASGDLAVTTLPGRQLRVYYRSTDGGIYYVQQDQNAASGWSNHRHLLGMSASAKNTSGVTLLSQTLYSNPVIGVNPGGQQEMFYVGSEGTLWHMRETAASSPAQPYPAWSPQASLVEPIVAPRGNSIIVAAHTGVQPIASYTVPDAATVYDIISTKLFFDLCFQTPGSSFIGYSHPIPACGNTPTFISRGMGIALLIDDIQTAIAAVKTNTTGSVTQAQFDKLVKTQLTKMGVL